MSVGADLLEALAELGEHAALPALKAVHLPQAGEGDGKQSAFCAVELADGSIGLTYLDLGDSRQRLAGMDLSPFAGAEALHVIAGCATSDQAQRILGFATANALTRWFFDRAGFVPPASADSIGGLHLGPGAKVGMVGMFVPLVERIVAAGADLTVLELPPEQAGERGGWRVTLDANDLADSQQVLCTSTVLLNDTLEPVLAACKAAREFVLIGPGASGLPDPLFAHGVTRLGGSWITDGAGVIDALRSGRGWTAHSRKFDLARADYPGMRSLLHRL